MHSKKRLVVISKEPSCVCEARKLSQANGFQFPKYSTACANSGYQSFLPAHLQHGYEVSTRPSAQILLSKRQMCEGLEKRPMPTPSFRSQLHLLLMGIFLSDYGISLLSRPSPFVRPTNFHSIAGCCAQHKYRTKHTSTSQTITQHTPTSAELLQLCT